VSGIVEISPFLAALKQDGQQDHLMTGLETYKGHCTLLFKDESGWCMFSASCELLHQLNSFTDVFLI